MKAEEFLKEKSFKIIDEVCPDKYRTVVYLSDVEAYAKHIIKSVSDENVEIQSGVVYHLAKPLRNAFKTGTKWLKSQLLKKIEQ